MISLGKQLTYIYIFSVHPTVKARRKFRLIKKLVSSISENLPLCLYVEMCRVLSSNSSKTIHDHNVLKISERNVFVTVLCLLFRHCIILNVKT